MTEFIIVGRGLAATTLAHTFYQHQISFKIIGDPNLSTSSKVAAGIWNPVVFKRLTKSWLAEDLVPCLLAFYSECEQCLQKKIITERPIIKPFTEDQEKILWKKKATTDLKNFLEPDVQSLPTPELEYFKIINGYGIVRNSGNLNVSDFLEASSGFFKEHILEEVFDYRLLQTSWDHVKYKELEAKHIIFCEGYLVKDNPFFNWIPLKPAKGEILTIDAPELRLKNSIFNRNGFLMDISKGRYRAGATYAWDDLTRESTEKGLEELHSKIRQMISCDYSVIKREAGIRPSSVDRRPIIGAHPIHQNLFVFNGLGTKGVMLAPYFVKNFVNFYLQKEQLNKEVDIKRFYHLYDTKN